MKENKELQQLLANRAAAGRQPAADQPTPVVTVAMVRDPAYGTPITADVHPDEVANWQAHGWEIDE